jgi:hypothetical protein
MRIILFYTDFTQNIGLLHTCVEQTGHKCGAQATQVRNESHTSVEESAYKL